MSKTSKCPWCGSQPERWEEITTPGDHWFYVGCRNEDCAAQPKVRGFKGYEFADAKWRYRVPGKMNWPKYERTITINTTGGFNFEGTIEDRNAWMVYFHGSQHLRDIQEAERKRIYTAHLCCKDSVHQEADRLNYYNADARLNDLVVMTYQIAEAWWRDRQDEKQRLDAPEQGADA